MRFSSRCESISKVEATVSEIIGTVREKGDAALREYSKKFDKADLTELLVSEDEIDEAVSSVEPEFIEYLSERLRISANFTPSRYATPLSSPKRTE